MLRGPPLETRRAVGLGDGNNLSAEADLIGRLPALELPGIAVCQPVLGELDLPALAHFLAEHTVLIADAVAIGWDPERRHRIHEARGEATKAAIAERRIGLEIDEVAEVDIEVLECL